MGITPAIIGGLGAGIFSGIAGNNTSNAITQAGNTQIGYEQQGVNTIQGLLGSQQGNQQPYIGSGATSLGQLMSGIQDGTFGGVNQAPQFQGGTFSAPTLQQAQQTPGYQFSQQQGNKGILEGSAAAGGAITGGTLKSLSQYDTNLANTTYNDVFNRSLSTYNAGLSQYQAQLAGFGAQQGAQQQAFGQLLAPAQLGETATNSLNNTETQQGENLANLYTNQGTAAANAIVGANKAQTQGLSGLFNSLFGGGGGSGGSLGQLITGIQNSGGSGNSGMVTPSQQNSSAISFAQPVSSTTSNTAWDPYASGGPG